METLIVLGACTYVQVAAYFGYCNGVDEGPKTGWATFAILIAMPFILVSLTSWHPH